MTTQPTSDALLPCPFCGKEAQINGEERYGFCVACDDIGCYATVGEGYDRVAMPSHSFATEADAIIAWNRRPDMTEELRTSDQKLVPGMQLYLVSNSNRTAPKFVTVTKVGRKWATIDDRHRVDLKTLEVESGGYSPWAKCWLRKEDYDASVEH